MSLWKHYHVAQSIEDALNALAEFPQPALPLAGGTDLLLDLQQSRHPPVNTLVDLSRVPELTRLEVRGDHLFIGAAVPVAEVAHSPLVKRHARAVSEGCGLIGGPQVRNTATLGGNVAHALPAADGMIGLLAVDAAALVADHEGIHERDLLNLFKGPGQSALIPGREILAGFQIPLTKPRQASAFRRIMRPQGVALPILNMAVWLEREGKLIKAIRIAVGPAGPIPQRAAVVEAFLTGKEYASGHVSQAIDLLHGSLHFRTSPHRASADYRYQVARELFKDVLAAAWERSLKDGGPDGA